MKPSSDIDLFTTTLPFPVLVFRTVLLQRIFAGCHPGLRVMTLRAPESHRLASDKGHRRSTIARRGLTRSGCSLTRISPEDDLRLVPL
jgi:hypothetical protein